MSHSRPDIHGVLFDLGDTILNFGPVDARSMFERGSRRAYERHKEFGFDLPPFARYHRMYLRAIEWKYFLSRLRGREFSSVELMRRITRKLGHDLNREQLLELAWLWYEPLGESAELEPGTARLLQDFRDQGLKLGLISNTFVPGEVLDRHLQHLGLLELLPVRVYSCDVGVRKPDRHIFTVALRKAGLTAGHTLFVGDSPRADIVGANRCGLISVLKDSHRLPKKRIRPDHKVERLAELREIVAEHNG
jgi:putative hydrolase of the HAD superfamily